MTVLKKLSLLQVINEQIIQRKTKYVKQNVIRYLPNNLAFIEMRSRWKKYVTMTTNTLFYIYGVV